MSRRVSMARFRQIETAERNSRLGALYQEILESGLGTGHPINWFTSQAERPDILEATWQLTKRLLFSGQLPPTVKQMIVVKVSTENQCRYCRVLHTTALEAMGVPAEVIDSLTTDVNLEKLTPPQRAIVQFGVKTAQDPRSVTDEDFETLRGHGFGDGEIMEVAMVAAFSNFINSWADVSAIEIDAGP
ncbi:MAG TPA: peroxidase-related enzyme [Vicinamibacteria bacterium]